MEKPITNSATGPTSRKEEKPVAAFPVCFHKDAFIPWEQATLHANSLAMRYALSVFEGIRLYVQSDRPVARAFRLDDHLDRLRRSLQLTRLPYPQGVNVADVVNEVIQRNDVKEDAYLRISVSADNFGDIGATVRTCLNVSISRMGRKRWLAEGRAMRVAISHWQRAAEASFPAAAKNISNYAGPRLALLEARDAGYDSVVLTNHDGFLCESPTAILFVVRDGILLTPPLYEGVLPSITRAAVFDICKTLGIEAREQRLSRTDAYLADEAFLCGTGLEFAPIAAFDSHALTDWKEWAVTPRVVEAYFQHVRGKALDRISEEQARGIAQGKGR